MTYKFSRNARSRRQMGNDNGTIAHEHRRQALLHKTRNILPPRHAVQAPRRNNLS